MRQIHGQGGDNGNKHGEAQIGGGKGFQAQFAANELAPVAAHGFKAAVQAALFGSFAAIQGNLLGMVAHAQEGGAVVGFAVLAFHVERLEPAADQMSKQRAGCRIGQRHPHQIAVHGDVLPEDFEGLHTG